MSLLSLPLTDKELGELDQILADRLDGVVFGDDPADIGIFSMSGLDGFMAAVVSGPKTLLPSQWLPVVWGDFEPQWKDLQEIEHVVSLMIRHQNSVITQFLDSEYVYEPIFSGEEGDEHENTFFVEDWCDGYLRAVMIDEEAWISKDEVSNHLALFALCASEDGEQLFGQISPEQQEEIRAMIPETAQALHTYWFARRP